MTERRAATLTFYAYWMVAMVNTGVWFTWIDSHATKARVLQIAFCALSLVHVVVGARATQMAWRARQAGQATWVYVFLGACATGAAVLARS